MEMTFLERQWIKKDIGLTSQHLGFAGIVEMQQKLNSGLSGKKECALLN